MDARPIGDLSAADLIRCPVWEFGNDSESIPGRDETWVVPVTTLPVTDLSNRVIAASLRLGNRKALGLLGNIDLGDVRSTCEFATLRVFHESSWFDLARYFDPDYHRRGPNHLAAFLGLTVSEIFPISYDISAAAVGRAEVVYGRIDIEPSARLTDDERLGLILGPG